jgi:putative DNA primase/helicase
MYIEKGELFTTKMLELYGSYEDTLTQIVQNRKMYDTTEDPAYNPYKEVLKIYDLYKKINGLNTEIREALHATCLWNVFKNISGDDDDPSQFMDEQEPDEKGKQKQPKLNLNKLANYLIKKYVITTYKDMIYCYIDDQYYNNADRLKKDLVKLLKHMGFSDHSKIKEIISDILYRITYETSKFRESPFNKKAAYLIPVRNGVIVLRDINTLLPNSPVFGFTYRLNVTYDPKADTKPVEEFLKCLVDTDEEYQLLLQISAQALMQDPDVTISYALVGGGANGKSTFLNLTTSTLGEQNCTAVSLQELSENKFSAAQLSGKLLNAFPDLPRTTIKTTSRFKALTGSDGILVENKYGQPFKLRNKAALVFSANALPEIEDSSYAFFRRFAIIEFNHIFKMDPEFAKRIRSPENLSGYLNLILDKLQRIQKYGFTQSNKVEENMEKWQRRSNSAFAFINEMLEKSATDYIKTDSIFSMYLNYCQDNDFTILSKIKFNDELEKFGAVTGRATEARTQIRVTKGIRLKPKILPRPQLEPEEAPIIF